MSITPDLLLTAYRMGIFPMARSKTEESVEWIEPQWRGVLTFDAFHCPRRLQRLLRQTEWRVTINICCDAVIAACAQERKTATETWINHQIQAWYGQLHALGYVHSLEVWTPDGILVGGLYGVALGGLFCGESMFSRMPNASKIAFVALVARLKAGGFSLLDTQFLTPHLAQFGVVEIPQKQYKEQIPALLLENGNYFSLPSPMDARDILRVLSSEAVPGDGK